MFFRSRAKREAHKEAEIQAIRQDMFKKIDKAQRSITKLSDLIEEEDLGITGNIFLAAGGQIRRKQSTSK